MTLLLFIRYLYDFRANGLALGIIVHQNVCHDFHKIMIDLLAFKHLLVCDIVTAAKFRQFFPYVSCATFHPDTKNVSVSPRMPDGISLSGQFL